MKITKDFADKLNKLSIEAHQNAVNKGFYNPSPNDYQRINLIVSELGEMIEAHRANRKSDLKSFNEKINDPYFENAKAAYTTFFKSYIKDTVEDELADIAIRILDFARSKNVAFFENGKHDYTLFEELMPKNWHQNTWLIMQELSFVDNFTSDGILEQHSFDDVIALLFVFAKKQKIDLLHHIELKMKYNALRPYKHNKKY